MSPTLDRRRAIASLAGMGAAGFITARAVTAEETPTPTALPGQGPFIIVSATGSASAAADHAIAQVILRAQYGPMPTDNSQASPVPLAPEVTAGDVSAVVAALIDQGLDESMILTSSSADGFGGGYFGPESGVVVFQVDGEQIKILPKLLSVATKTVSDLGLQFDQPGAMYLSDTCEDLRAAAFRDAVDKGAEEASLLADAMEVTLGDWRQARKQSVTFGPAAYGYTASDACADLVDLGTAIRSYLPPFDISLPAEFVVYAMVELTYTTI